MVFVPSVDGISHNVAEHTDVDDLAAGEPIEISDELAQAGYEQQGSDLGGWFQFQPWWEELLREEPDFLE